MTKTILIILAVLLGLWLVLEIGVRWYVESPLTTDFYASTSRESILPRQKQVGVQVVSGSGWVHLGWVADPDAETYRIEKLADDVWSEIGTAEYGSFLIHDVGGQFRVWRMPKNGNQPEVLGETQAKSSESPSPVFIPRITGEWKTLFLPKKSGYYLNDHTIYQDADGNWRLIGITSKTDGDYNQEKYFAVGISTDFPPVNGMTEAESIADFGELAWAPHVIQEGEKYHIFWSPHKLHQMDSKDGIIWENHEVTMSSPFQKFFRDGMVMQAAENQWLLYTTARGAYFSRVDIYQSFDLREWQYIGAALDSGFGSERNSPFSSMESPFVINYQGHCYLSLTYNNDSFFLPGILMLFKVWLNPQSYNDTLVFHSDNPYDFGVYRGRGNSPTLLTELRTHGPEYVYNPDTDAWFITTAGWPWVATLTSGEVAVAPLEWEPAPVNAP
jgi:arabinan endo-1,5-alpha-L-arabinosidase